MADPVRIPHRAVTLTVSFLLVAAVGALIYVKNNEVSEMARMALLSDPTYAESPANSMWMQSFAEQDRQVLFATVGLSLLLAIWLALATVITTREVSAQLRRLRQAIREVGGAHDPRRPALGAESSVTDLLTALHAEVSPLRDSMQWAPSASMVFRVEDAGRDRFIQRGFVWGWAFLAFIVFLGTQTLPILVWKLRTWPHVALGAAGWLVGGFLLAALSRGRTVLEPAVGALFAAQATLVYLILDVQPSLHGGKVTEYLLGTVAGFLLALAGAIAGEGLQTRLRKKRSEERRVGKEERA